MENGRRRKLTIGGIPDEDDQRTRFGIEIPMA